jgi:hypothetical protein
MFLSVHVPVPVLVRVPEPSRACAGINPITVPLISSLVSVLSDRHVQASEMSTETSSYFSRLTASVSAEDWHRWEREIKSAESLRLVEPAVMDILGAQDAEGNNGSVLAAEPDANTNIEKWIRKGIEIEERQYVAFTLNV